MEENVLAILADVSRLFRRSFDERARSIGVTRPQWQVLIVLTRNEGVNQGKLAELLDVEPITVCRMVDRLQESGLVERRADPADRRSWRLHLTDKGKGVFEQLRPLATTMLDDAFEGLSEVDLDTLRTTLTRMQGNLTRRPVSQMVSNG